jgi:hypothetical protein
VACVVSGWFIYRYASSRKLDKTEAAYLALIVGTTPILLLPGYGGELLFRAFLLVLPALVYYLVKNVSFRTVKIALVAILLLGPVVHFFVAYGNESFNYVSPAESSSYSFFYGTASNASVYGGYPVSDYFHQETYATKSIFQLVSLLRCSTLSDVGKAQLARGGSSYVFFTQGDEAIIRTLYAPQVDDYVDAKNVTANTSFFNLIYSSADVALYQVRPS